MPPNDLSFLLSGGVSNTDPNLSLGGLASTTELAAQSVAYGGSGVAGVTLTGGFGNDDSGVLVYEDATGKLFWNVNGQDGGSGNADEPTADGDFLLVTEDLSSQLLVNVDISVLQGADRSDDVVVTPIAANTLFRDITEAEALSGVVLYRAIYIENTIANDIGFVIYTDDSECGDATVDIGLMISDEADIPTLVDEYTLHSERDQPVFVQNLGAFVGASSKGSFWLRLTVPPTAAHKADCIARAVCMDEFNSFAKTIEFKFSIGNQQAYEDSVLDEDDVVSIEMTSVLTGSADSLPDLPLVLSSFSATLYRDEPSYMALVVTVDLETLVEDVAARPNGDLVVSRNYILTAGATALDDFSLPISNSRFDLGAINQSMTIEGRGVMSMPVAKTVTLNGISQKRSIVENTVSYTEFVIQMKHLKNIYPDDTFSDGGNSYRIERIAIQFTGTTERVGLVCLKQ